MQVALLVLAVAGNFSLPLPPYVRLATRVVTREVDNAPFVVSGSTFYVADTVSCAAYDLRSLKRKWWLKLPTGKIMPHVQLLGHELFVHADVGHNKRARLYAVDTTSGRLAWSLAGTGQPADVVGDGAMLYVGLNRTSVAAVDTRSRRVKWQSKLSVDKGLGPDSGIDTMTVTGHILLVNANGYTEAFDRRSASRLWQIDKSYSFGTTLPVSSGIVWAPTDKGSVGVDIESGREKWRSEVDPTEFVAFFGGLFVGSGDGRVDGLDPKSGQKIWSIPLGSAQAIASGVSGAVLGNDLYIHSLDRAAVIDSKGRARWHGLLALAPAPPVFADGNRLVCFDGARLLAYQHGTRPSAPPGPRARSRLARRMIREFDSLDDADEARLGSLGDAAFRPALSAYVRACADFDAKENGPDAMGVMGRAFRLEHILDRVTTKRRWRDFAGALEPLPRKSHARQWLQRKVGELGPRCAVIRLFVRELKKCEGLTLYDSNNTWAENYVSLSSDPTSVAFMIRALNDPRADPEQRDDAYVNLARTGGAAGLKAVLAMRRWRTRLEPLAARVIGGLNPTGHGARTKVVRQRRDESGRTWGLLQSDALGNYGDLWLAEKVDGRWRRPLFTGVSIAARLDWVEGTAVPPSKIDGKTGAQLLAGDWLDILKSNAAIRRDTAGSGMTDVEKLRLGLDPTKKDTDGDGVPDAVDAWPNVASHPLSESEQVLAAVFEARYRFSDSDGPAVFEAPASMKPFEMPGRNGPTIWTVYSEDDKHDTPLEQCFGSGVIFISFGSPKEKPAKDDTDVIEWNATKTEASVMISTSHTGLSHNGIVVTARKFGATWVVISEWTRYV